MIVFAQLEVDSGIGGSISTSPVRLREKDDSAPERAGDYRISGVSLIQFVLDSRSLFYTLGHYFRNTAGLKNIGTSQRNY